MSILFFLEDDGIVNYLTSGAQGTAITEGAAVAVQQPHNNTVEYTPAENVSQTAEYRHLPKSNRDSTHRR